MHDKLRGWIMARRAKVQLIIEIELSPPQI